MTDYTKQCWNCRSTNLIQIDDFSACNTCGATYNDLPKLRESPVSLQPDTGFRWKSSSPSKRLQHRVRKQREGGIKCR